MSIALQKIEEIKRLRREGLTFNQIGKRTNVSGSTARNHGKNEKPIRERTVYETRNICRALYKGLKCQRDPGHRGIHSSDETGKLVSWDWER